MTVLLQMGRDLQNLTNLVCNEEKLKTKLNKFGSRTVCLETRLFDENVQRKVKVLSTWFIIFGKVR